MSPLTPLAVCLYYLHSRSSSTSLICWICTLVACRYTYTFPKVWNPDPGCASAWLSWHSGRWPQLCRSCASVLPVLALPFFFIIFILAWISGSTQYTFPIHFMPPKCPSLSHSSSEMFRSDCIFFYCIVFLIVFLCLLPHGPVLLLLMM